jgi:NAD(P)H-dependent FMN reductase
VVARANPRETLPNTKALGKTGIDMDKPRIGIVISTTRMGRFADKPVKWLWGLASSRADMEFEIVDLRVYPLPFFDERASPARKPPENPLAQRWARKVGELDGFIFVTGEYNHGVPAVLKNALDYAFTEFNRKPAAYVGYGGVGAARAVEQLRLINVELEMAPLRAAVHIGGADFVGMLAHGRSFADSPQLEPAARAMLDELSWWARVLKAARAATSVTATG